MEVLTMFCSIEKILKELPVNKVCVWKKSAFDVMWTTDITVLLSYGMVFLAGF